MRLLTSTVFLILGYSSIASAQELRVEAQAGRIRSALDPSRRDNTTAAAGITYNDPTSAFRIQAGIPVEPESPYWGSAAAYKRLAIRKNGFLLGADFTGQGYAFQDRTQPQSGTLGGLFDPFQQATDKRSGTAFAAQAMPLIGFASGPFELRARMGASYYIVSVDNQSHSRTVPLGDIELTIQPAPAFAITPLARRYQPDNEDASTFAGASAVMAIGRSSVWANAGQWIGVDTISSAKTAWAAGTTLGITDRVNFNASARHDGFDPLYLAPSQTSWSAGLSILLGGSPRAATPVTRASDDGMTRIRLPLSSSPEGLSIAGDFNSWSPQKMQQDGKYWVYEAPLSKGVYQFSFVSAQGKFFVPEKYPGRKSDGMGGHVAVLVVR